MPPVGSDGKLCTGNTPFLSVTSLVLLLEYLIMRASIVANLLCTVCSSAPALSRVGLVHTSAADVCGEAAVHEVTPFGRGSGGGLSAATDFDRGASVGETVDKGVL